MTIFALGPIFRDVPDMIRGCSIGLAIVVAISAVIIGLLWFFVMRKGG
jgi:hypothetical protein